MLYVDVAEGHNHQVVYFRDNAESDEIFHNVVDGWGLTHFEHVNQLGADRSEEFHTSQNECESVASWPLEGVLTDNWVSHHIEAGSDLRQDLDM